MILHWINSHGLETLAGYGVFSAAISALPTPDATSGKGYRWLYAFAHGLALNLDKIKDSINPPLK